MKRKIRINPKARIAYISKDLIDQGFTDEVDAFANTVTLTIIKPGALLDEIKHDLEIVLKDVEFRQKLENK